VNRLAIFFVIAFPAVAVTDGHLPTPDYHRQPGDAEGLIAGIEEVAGVTPEAATKCREICVGHTVAVIHWHKRPSHTAREALGTCPKNRKSIGRLLVTGKFSITP